MPALLQLYLDPFLVFLLVLARVGGMMSIAPIYGSRSVPVRIRALLAIGISMLITPVQATTAPEDPENIVNLTITLAGEASLGLALGLGVFILLAGIQLAGQMIGHLSGMALADVIDPSLDLSVPVFSRFLDVTTMAVFVIIGGHRYVMAALLDTFAWSPPGQGVLGMGVVDALTDILTQSFSLGIRAAAPAIVALLLSVIVTGLISRTLPQLNVLAIGFSLNALIALATLLLTVGSVAWLFQGRVEIAVDTMLNGLFGEPMW